MDSRTVFFAAGFGPPMANLPVTINNFVQSPYAYWKQLAWSGALLITLTVLALNIGARIIGAERTAK
jgi:phosphate transport system permease protein